VIDVVTPVSPTTGGPAAIARQLAAHLADHRTITTAVGRILQQPTTQARMPANLDLLEGATQ
jgi:hypothetical protein